MLSICQASQHSVIWCLSQLPTAVRRLSGALTASSESLPLEDPLHAKKTLSSSFLPMASLQSLSGSPSWPTSPLATYPGSRPSHVSPASVVVLVPRSLVALLSTHILLLRPRSLLLFSNGYAISSVSPNQLSLRRAAGPRPWMCPAPDLIWTKANVPRRGGLSKGMGCFGACQDSSTKNVSLMRELPYLFLHPIGLQK